MKPSPKYLSDHAMARRPERARFPAHVFKNSDQQRVSPWERECLEFCKSIGRYWKRETANGVFEYVPMAFWMMAGKRCHGKRKRPPMAALWLEFVLVNGPVTMSSINARRI